MRTFASLLGIVVLMSAGAGYLHSQGAGTQARSPRAQWSEPPEVFTARVVAKDLENPWEVLWGPDGFLWITERSGKRVVRVDPTDGTRTVLATIDEVHQSLVHDGLLGMALHPQLLRGTGADFVYLAYTYDADPGAALDRRFKIRRYTYDRTTQTLGSPSDVITGLPHGTDHGAGRLLIGPDLKLYVSRGDHGANFQANFCLPNRAQELPSAAEVAGHDWTRYQGKILRINLDGSIPADNPVLAGVRSHIYTFGHRNVQGMAFTPDGRLYASEHGQDTDDEVNLIRPGRNYGWPLIAGFKDGQYYAYRNWSASAPAPCSSLTFSRNVPASVPRIEEREVELPNFAPPVKTFFTVPTGYDQASLGNATVAPAGVDVYTSAAIPGWRNSLLMTGMTSGVVFRMSLPSGDGPLGAPVTYFRAKDRYRDLAIAPDGTRIFVVTDSRGGSVTDTGALTSELAHPGSLIEFTYSGPRTPPARP